MSSVCNSCKRGPPEVTLKRCAKCSTTPYCSRECQKNDWKSHKKICSKNSASAEPSSAGVSSANTQRPSVKGLDKPTAKPFTRLGNGTWLHDRPEIDVYRLLIDAYRMRMEDNYNLEGDADDDGLYAGNAHGLPGFKRFLELASRRPRLLPSWWDDEKTAACAQLGMDSSQWCSLHSAVEKSDIIEHYGDSMFPMQLRMLGEAVYGKGPGGQNGAMMREMLASRE